MKQLNYPGRITKPVARRRWRNNEPFVIVPCKCFPYDAFGDLDEFAVLVNPEKEKQNFSTFEWFYDNYAYYNCNTIVGMYPAFYIPNSEREL